MTAPTDTDDQPFNQVSKPIQVLVWLIQIFLTVTFLFFAWVHLATPIAQLHKFVTWFAVFPDWVLRGIGVVEGIAALAFFLPSVLRIKPGLSILAGAVLTMAMFIATSMHFVHQEYAVIPYPAVLAVLSGYVALMRMTRAQVKGR